MSETKLIIVEGIMGSGKSTTAAWIAQRLRAQHREAAFVSEGEDPHPIRVMQNLAHPFAPWLDLSVEAYIEHIVERWATWSRQAEVSGDCTVFDGQLFHGDMTNLLMMKASYQQIEAYILQINQLLAALNPVLIYCYQTDLLRALRNILDDRGAEWEAFQIGWKCQSPYCQERGWQGRVGLLALYTEYRSITDALFEQLDLKKLALETSAGDWGSYYEEIGGVLGFDVG